MDVCAMTFTNYTDHHEVNVFFHEFIQAFVPPWYYMKASEVAKSTRRDFLRLWSWAFEQLMKSTGTPYELGVIGRYCHGVTGDSVAGATSLIGEIYKSSFVQTVDWFLSNGWLDPESAKEHALTICPLDLSLWDISSVPSPKWWPKGSQIEKLDQVSELAELQQCRELIKIESEGNLLLGAEGAVLRPESGRSLISVFFKLMPFAYAIRGSDLPSPKLIARILSRNFWQKAPTNKEPLSLFFSSFDGWMPFFQDATITGDMFIVPLLSRMESNNTNIWQWWRGHDAPFFPAESLITEGQPGFDATSWFYTLHGGPVCRIYDWKVGTLEISNPNEYPAHGQWAFADSKWLYNILESNDCRLGYVLSVDVRHRKDAYSKAEAVHFDDFIQLSSVVL
jgi:hypothetical protein